jgi:SAM-dependent methyltransferase
MKTLTNELFLPDEALKAFDKDFRDWPIYQPLLEGAINEGEIFSVLDVGGGNGQFVDRLLQLYPSATGCVFDYSSSMLSKSRPDSRKTLVQGSATELGKHFSGRRFDLITVNMLLHHLVGQTEKETLENVNSCLLSIRELLTPTGHLIVYEQTYEGVLPGLQPGKIIFSLTSVKNTLISRALRNLGANTAGTGVRFRSRNEWIALFQGARFKIRNDSPVTLDKPPMLRKLPLNIKQVGSHFFALCHSDPAL